ncbi:hypothetical protein CASFOL_017614 [Castilleja foliolosa]|uniref:TRF2/HOY1 PH-like domain-containing protein n=1 Tax=Castilleja foliolosa TaxID=1961234 RepID=A0ABD3D7Q9_9LAMI
MEKEKQVWFDANINMDMRGVEEQQVDVFPNCSTRIVRNIQGIFESCSPLGLTLTKSPSFENFFETQSYPPQEQAFFSSQYNNHRNSRATTSSDNLVTQPSTEKLKATNFCITSIHIGGWQRNSQNEGDMIAKLYYGKRKIVWEVLDDKVMMGCNVKHKNKIEILWSNITAIQAIFQDDQFGILKIELDKPPMFFRETEPKPTKHTNWQSENYLDFTNGCAFNSRIHCVKFPPKVLDKHYENLLQSDQRLFKLSREPFPSQRSPYFQAPIIMTNFNAFGSPAIQQYQGPTNHPAIPRGLSIRPSPNPVMGFQGNYQLVAQRQRPHPVWENGEMNNQRANTINTQIGPSSSSSHSQTFSTGQPNGPLTFHGANNLHAQMPAVDLVIDPTDNNYNNWTETADVDYSILPFVSPDEDLLLLDRLLN